MIGAGIRPAARTLPGAKWIPGLDTGSARLEAMVRIRLRRIGKKKQPSYRVVVADSHAPREGAFIEAIGRYNPRTDPSEIEIDAERARAWLRQGAQPSDAVVKLLKVAGVLAEDGSRVSG